MAGSDQDEVIARWRALYKKMRDVAAGYSNMADENGTTRRLDHEFNVAQAEFHRLNILDGKPEER